MALSAWWKFFSTLDFGYNMYDYKDIDLSKCVSTGSFMAKLVTLFLMILTIYITYFKDKKLLKDYFEGDQRQI